MYITLWILLCLLASIGAVQALSWLVCALGRPPGQTGLCRACHVIPLTREPGLLEQQLRYEIHLLRWSSQGRPGQLILLDTGLGKEAQQVCANLLQGMHGVIICTPDELPGLVNWEGCAAAQSV